MRGEALRFCTTLMTPKTDTISPPMAKDTNSVIAPSLLYL